MTKEKYPFPPVVNIREEYKVKSCPQTKDYPLYQVYRLRRESDFPEIFPYHFKDADHFVKSIIEWNSWDSRHIYSVFCRFEPKELR